MNQLQSLLFAASLHAAPIQPIVPQTYYVANLNETDGAKCGEYISVTPINQPVIPQYHITPCVIVLEDKEGE
jgi:hypothetical protein